MEREPVTERERIFQPNETEGDLAEKILDRSARVGIIGLGIVGLPLSVEMAKAGFEVIGIDIDRSKVESVNAGISYDTTVASETLFSFVRRKAVHISVAGLSSPTFAQLERFSNAELTHYAVRNQLVD